MCAVTTQQVRAIWRARRTGVRAGRGGAPARASPMSGSSTTISAGRRVGPSSDPGFDRLLIAALCAGHGRCRAVSRCLASCPQWPRLVSSARAVLRAQSGPASVDFSTACTIRVARSRPVCCSSMKGTLSEFELGGHPACACTEAARSKARRGANSRSRSPSATHGTRRISASLLDPDRRLQEVIRLCFFQKFHELGSARASPAVDGIPRRPLSLSIERVEH